MFKKYQPYLDALLVFLLAGAVRLTSLNVFLAVDEEDRWAWAVAFYRALLAGDLPGTLVGDGYPGIFPVWLETVWLLAASLYRSVLQGGWFGNDGAYLLIHEWSRADYLGMQRFPVVFTNTLLVVAAFLYIRRLFGRSIALLAAIFICLDPFYLSDSRVNRAEGLLTGLMTLSLLAFIAALRGREGEEARRQEAGNDNNSQFTLNHWHLALAALFTGLAWLTKSQALVLIPMFAVIIFIWLWRPAAIAQNALIPRPIYPLFKFWLLTLLTWIALAALTFIALWPATWTVPGPTFTRMFTYLSRKVGEEGVKLFFMGQTILNDDPGFFFYPVIFILRATPVMLAGLFLGLWLILKHFKVTYQTHRLIAFSLDATGIWAIIAYVLLYVVGMSLGSHKQDRFLMAVFPALNILAAIAFVSLARQRNWSTSKMWAGGTVLVALQLFTALPFHPYYFSYFNPLVGGGPVATRLTRVGWGEGMDQAGAYLQSLPQSDSLLVASRFSRYLLGFKGDTVNLDADGDWVRADKVVFYIQQSQRMLDPSPGVIRYFQQHVPPEKTITINGIDYAQIYANPIQYPANPLVDTVADQVRLLGYRWGEGKVRLIWENLSETPNPLGVRLWANTNAYADWSTCTVAPGFETAAHTPGEVVESDCSLASANLASGLTDLQVGFQATDGSWQPLEFAAGRSVVEVLPNGNLQRVSAEEAFARLAQQHVPPSASLLEHLYANQVRLLAIEITPKESQPGQPLTVTLYWQAQRVPDKDVHVSLQAFVGDNQRVAIVNTPPQKPTSQWHPGEVIRQEIILNLPPDLLTPLLLRLDVSLFLPETGNPLPVTNLQGQDIPGEIVTMRLEPETWPEYIGNNPLNFTFGEAVTLTGYDLDNELGLTLFWQAAAPLDQNLTTFVHLLAPDGTLIAQSDVLPNTGLYPTSAWQPGEVIQSYHRLTLPDNVSPGNYTLTAGLYTPTDFARLPVTDASGQPIINNTAPIGQITLP